VFLLVMWTALFHDSASTGFKAWRSWRNSNTMKFTSCHTQSLPGLCFHCSKFRFHVSLQFVCCFDFESLGSCFLFSLRFSVVISEGWKGACIWLTASILACTTVKCIYNPLYFKHLENSVN
jgi:hypothetical protein